MKRGGKKHGRERGDLIALAATTVERHKPGPIPPLQQRLKNVPWFLRDDFQKDGWCK